MPVPHLQSSQEHTVLLPSPELISSPKVWSMSKPRLPFTGENERKNHQTTQRLVNQTSQRCQSVRERDRVEAWFYLEANAASCEPHFDLPLTLLEKHKDRVTSATHRTNK